MHSCTHLCYWLVKNHIRLKIQIEKKKKLLGNLVVPIPANTRVRYIDQEIVNNAKHVHVYLCTP